MLALPERNPVFFRRGGEITSYTGEYAILFTAVLSMACRQEFCVKNKCNFKNWILNEDNRCVSIWETVILIINHLL